MENQKLVSELNILVEINNDRINGYEKAVNETTDTDLKTIFSKAASQSRKFNTDLIREVTLAGGKPVEGTTTSGKFYRAWMDIKSALTGRDRKAILASCEFGEDVARETYKKVLDSAFLTPDLRSLVTSQFNEITSTHNEVKKMRDSIEVEH